MPLTVTHPYVSSRVDSSDTTLVNPSNWNSSHAVSGTIESSNVTGLGPFTANQVIYASSVATASGMSGTTWSDSNRTLTITGSSSGVTASTPVLNLSQTWNAVAQFIGLELSLTGLSFAGGSKLFNIDWQGNPTFYVGTDGYARIAGGLDIFGSANSPGINLTATWNVAPATFYGLNMNITNTNSGPNSRLVSLTVSSSQVFAIDVNGAIVKGTLPSSQLTGTLPASQGGTGLTTYTVGDLVVASSANLLAPLSDAATGNALISGGAGASPTYGKIGLGTHVSGTLASSQIVSVGSSQISTQIGSTQLAVPFTVGFSITPYSTGTISAGTFTPNPINGNYQYYTNGGAHTIAASTVDSAIDILLYNSSSAGAITLSGFTVGSNTGDPLNTVSSNRFLVNLRRINGISMYNITALQ